MLNWCNTACPRGETETKVSLSGCHPETVQPYDVEVLAIFDICLFLLFFISEKSQIYKRLNKIEFSPFERSVLFGIQNIIDVTSKSSL